MTWKKPRAERDAILRPAIIAAGGCTVVAAALRITKAAVSQWRHVPEKRLRRFAALSGFPAKLLRPDLFKKPSIPE